MVKPTYVVTIKTDDSSSALAHHGTKGMKWGRRRFQNEDGSLTELGKKRYAKETRDIETSNTKNTALVTKEQGDRAHQIDVNKAVDKMVKDDLKNTKTITNEGSKAATTLSTAVKNTKVNVSRMDLSSMSDDEMRSRIQREQLESQYDSMFNAKRHRVEGGKQTVAAIIGGIGVAAAVTSSALEIALAVKKLKG